MKSGIKKYASFISAIILITAVSFANPTKLFAKTQISPVEDLMREHGVLSRILLIYTEILSRLSQGREFPLETLSNSADIVREFIEDYHEKLEENYIFPAFEKQGKFVELVKVLRRQHAAGRNLTDGIKVYAVESVLKKPDTRKKLARSLRLFIQMYRPHKAREDTVLFPTTHSIFSSQEYAVLGDKFEDKEKELFGENGFDKIVSRVAEIEKELGIYDLSKFTP